MLRLADLFMRLEAQLSYALIGLVQATGSAGGIDYMIFFFESDRLMEGTLDDLKLLFPA